MTPIRMKSDTSRIQSLVFRAVDVETKLRCESMPLTRSGPAFIALGLAGLLAATICPTLPAATAFAIVILGATNATIERLRRSSALIGMVLLHSTVYAMLYSLIVGATLHKAAGHISLALAGDLLLSLVPIVIAAKHITGTLQRELFAS